MSVLVTDLKPHLALVTGASGGIGRATCLALANLGCSIAVHYHSSEDKAVALINELKAKGVRAEAFKADLTKYEEVMLPRCYPAIDLVAPHRVEQYHRSPDFAYLGLIDNITGPLTPQSSRSLPRRTNNPIQQRRSHTQKRHQSHNRNQHRGF